MGKDLELQGSEENFAANQLKRAKSSLNGQESELKSTKMDDFTRNKSIVGKLFLYLQSIDKWVCNLPEEPDRLNEPSRQLMSFEEAEDISTDFAKYLRDNPLS